MQVQTTKTNPKHLVLKNGKFLDLINQIDDHYLLINFLLPQELMTVNGSCVECSCTETIVKNTVDKTKGWPNKLNISCCECGWTKYFYASKGIDIPRKSGQKFHELNTRSVMAFRETEQGLESMKPFSHLMNTNDPIYIKACNVINNHLFEAYVTDVDNSMFKVKEINEKQKESRSVPGECRQTALFPLMGHCKDEGMMCHCKDWKDKTIP